MVNAVFRQNGFYQIVAATLNKDSADFKQTSSNKEIILSSYFLH